LLIWADSGEYTQGEQEQPEFYQNGWRRNMAIARHRIAAGEAVAGDDWPIKSRLANW